MAVRTRAARTEFTIIPRLTKFVKSFCEKKYFFIFPKMLDFLLWVWYTNNVRRGRTLGRGLETVSPTVVVRAGRRKKILKNLLTNPSLCGIIRV